MRHLTISSSTYAILLLQRLSQCPYSSHPDYLLLGVELTTDGTRWELDGVGVGKEALDVGLELGDGEVGSSVG